jgi:hypothetical protein
MGVILHVKLQGKKSVRNEVDVIQSTKTCSSKSGENLTMLSGWYNYKKGSLTGQYGTVSFRGYVYITTCYYIKVVRIDWQ